MARPTTNDAAVAGRLAEAAYSLLSEFGPEAVTVRKVAGAAGASTTAIYSLYGGREALIEAAAARAADELCEIVAQAATRVQGTEAGTGGLERMAIAHLEWALNNPHLYRAVYRGRVPVGPSTCEPHAKVPEWAEPLLRSIQGVVETGYLMECSRITAMGIWGSLHGLAALTLSRAMDSDTAIAATVLSMNALLRVG